MTAHHNPIESSSLSNIHSNKNMFAFKHDRCRYSPSSVSSSKPPSFCVRRTNELLQDREHAALQ